MLDIGVQELLVLMVIALLVFGPDKLPDLGRRLGRAMREFRRASDEFRATIETNLNLHEESILPPSAASTPPSSAATDVAAAPAVEAPVALAPGSEPTDVPRGLTPDVSGPFEESDGAILAPRDPFCMPRGGRLLHRATCTWAARIPETDRIAMKTAGEGWELGLKPCPVCDPQEILVTA